MSHCLWSDFVSFITMGVGGSFKCDAAADDFLFTVLVRRILRFLLVLRNGAQICVGPWKDSLVQDTPKGLTTEDVCRISNL